MSDIYEYISLIFIFHTSGTEDGTVKLWNTTAKRVVQEMLMAPSYLPRVVDIACHPCGTTFIASVTSADETEAQVCCIPPFSRQIYDIMALL